MLRDKVSKSREKVVGGGSAESELYVQKEFGLLCPTLKIVQCSSRAQCTKKCEHRVTSYYDL